MAAKTGELTANGAKKKKFLRRDFGDLEVQMEVGDVTSPIAVLGILDFGNNWGERAWDRISGQRGYFPVSVSNFADLGLEVKVKTGLGLDLGKILQSWSWTSRSRLQL